LDHGQIKEEKGRMSFTDED